MSHNQRRGGVSLFASSKPAADDDSDSSDDAPIPQKFQKRPKRVQSSESSELESDSEDGSSEVGSSDDSSESDESLEELQREMEEIPFEELRAMQREEGIGIRRRRASGVKESSDEEEPKGGKSKKSKKSKDSKEEDKKLSKRQLKNAPIVVSAKAPLSRRPRQVVQLPKQETRDPRFDGLSGTFSEETFRKSYGFIDDIKKGEIVQLKQAIRKERRYDERAKLREALQIMENRMRSDKQKQKQKEIIRQHKKQEREKVRQGKNPYFLKEKRVKEMELEKKFEELKSKGGDNEVERYLRDKRKRKAQKEVRFMPFKRRAVEGADGSPMPAGN